MAGSGQLGVASAVAWTAEAADGVLTALADADVEAWSLVAVEDVTATRPADFSIRSAALGRDLRCHLATSAPTLLDAVRSAGIAPRAVAGVVLVRDAFLVVDRSRPDLAAVADPGWWTDRALRDLTTSTPSPDAGAPREAAVPVRLGYALAADEGQAPTVRVRSYDGAGSPLDSVRRIVHSGREHPGVPALLAGLVRGGSALAGDRRPGDFNEVVAAALYETASEAAGFGRLGMPSHGLVAELPHEPDRRWPAFLARAARVTTWTRWHDLYLDLAATPGERCLAPWMTPPVAPLAAGMGDRAEVDLDLLRVVARWSLPDVREARSWFVEHADRSRRRELARTMRSCGWLRPWAPRARLTA